MGISVQQYRCVVGSYNTNGKRMYRSPYISGKFIYFLNLTEMILQLLTKTNTNTLQETECITLISFIFIFHFSIAMLTSLAILSEMPDIPGEGILTSGASKFANLLGSLLIIILFIDYYTIPNKGPIY